MANDSNGRRHRLQNGRSTRQPFTPRERSCCLGGYRGEAVSPNTVEEVQRLRRAASAASSAIPVVPTAMLNHVTSSQVHALVVVGVATCWGMIVLAWAVGALYTASRGPRAETRALRSNLSTGFVVAAVAWAIVRVFPRSDWHSLAVETPWVRVLGLAILICSTAFALWARVALGTMWSSSPTVKVQHQLRTNGPYGVTRHPIYTGLLGMTLGTVLLVGFGQWLVLLPVGLVFIEIRIHIEEGLMLATFPEAYPPYRRRVPQLVPGLRRLHRSRTAGT